MEPALPARVISRRDPQAPNGGTEFARVSGVNTPPLNRPPRTKRPPEVVRHVDESMDAYRQVQARKKKAATGAGKPSERTGP